MPLSSLQSSPLMWTASSLPPSACGSICIPGVQMWHACFSICNYTRSSQWDFRISNSRQPEIAAQWVQAVRLPQCNCVLRLWRQQREAAHLQGGAEPHVELYKPLLLPTSHSHLCLAKLQGWGGLSLQQFWELMDKVLPIVFYAPLFQASIRSNHHLQISLIFRRSCN